MERDKLMLLAASFLTGLAQRTSRIAAQAQRGALETLVREAHDLKSTAGSFGARRMQYLGAQLEAACRDSDRAAVDQYAAAITAILPETRAALLAHYPDIDLDQPLQ